MPRKRMRSERRIGMPGSGWAGDRFPGSDSPYVADPKAKIERPKRHFCGECFRPRSHYAEALFCGQCEVDLFGYRGYKRFLQSTRQKLTHRRKKSGRERSRHGG